jgi:hypothetical protein
MKVGFGLAPVATVSITNWEKMVVLGLIDKLGWAFHQNFATKIGA